MVLQSATLLSWPTTLLHGTQVAINSSGHRQKLTAFHIVDKAADVDALGNKRRIPEQVNIIAHRLLQVTEWQEVDVPRVGLEVLPQFRAQLLIAKGEHTAVRMVDDHNMRCSEQLLGDDERAERIGSPTARVANDMRIALLKPEGACRVNTRIHAGQHGHLAGRRHS